MYIDTWQLKNAFDESHLHHPNPLIFCIALYTSLMFQVDNDNAGLKLHKSSMEVISDTTGADSINKVTECLLNPIDYEEGTTNNYYEGNIITGSNGVDTLHGCYGHDVVNGSCEDDRILGSAGDDVLHGCYGNDVVNGSCEDDRILGCAGDVDNALIGKDFLPRRLRNRVNKILLGIERVVSQGSNNVYSYGMYFKTEILNQYQKAQKTIFSRYQIPLYFFFSKTECSTPGTKSKSKSMCYVKKTILSNDTCQCEVRNRKRNLTGHQYLTQNLKL